MNDTVSQLYDEYLQHTGGDRTAAASLTLAAVMVDGREAPVPVGPTALTVAEVAARLKITRKTVYQMCRSHRMRCYRAGRSLRIPLEEIERFENESGARDPAPRFPDLFKRHC